MTLVAHGVLASGALFTVTGAGLRRTACVAHDFSAADDSEVRA